MTAQPLAKWTARSPMPNTIMASAFLNAVMRWTTRQTKAKRMTLPSRDLDADELRRVIVALTCAQSPTRR